ncbi:MAG: urease accessory protein UreD [Betaproteobacteria bacterium]|nr:urease accessory protein UreD [Betaproteobacteria bacterium]
MKPVSWEARLALRFAQTGTRTVLADRRHSGPLVVQKALYPEGDAVCHAVIVHPPGGIAGGDRLSIEASIEPGARALITTPGATRWYRSAGPLAEQAVRLRVAAGASLEWLPQETIYFEGCRAANRIAFDVEPGGTLLAWEIACLGRVRSNERFARGEAFQSLSFESAGRLRWIERGRLVAGNRALASGVGLGGQSVIGTTLFRPVKPAEGVRLLAAFRSAGNCIGGETGLTLLGDMIVGRYLGDSAEQARAVFAGWWAMVRPSLIERPAIRPRIWST